MFIGSAFQGQLALLHSLFTAALYDEHLSRVSVVPRKKKSPKQAKDYILMDGTFRLMLDLYFAVNIAVLMTLLEDEHD